MAIPASHDIPPDHFRNVLGNFPTGVVGITSIGPDGAPVGMTVGSFVSVSLDPPLVAFLPDKSSTTFPKVRAAGRFCANVLGSDQEDVCRAFAVRGADKFAGLRWHPGRTGAPVLDEAIAWIDCDIESVTDAGDHYIVLGRVRELATVRAGLPLLFFQRGYGRFSSLSLTAPAEPDLIEKLRLADIVRPHIEQLATRLGTACMASALVGGEVVVLAGSGLPADREFATRVGQRMPFVAPLGAVFAAFSTRLEQRWTATLTQAGPAELALYRQLCDRVRARGWSVALSSEAHREFEQTLASVPATGIATQDLTAVRQAVAGLNEVYEPDTLAVGQTYTVRNLSVPVLGADREPLLALTAYGLPGDLTGRQIEEYAARLIEASEAVAPALQ